MTSTTRRTVLAGLVLSGLCACSAQRTQIRRLVIATGGRGGVYYALGTAFASVVSGWGTDATVKETGASIENLHLVAAGQADLGFATIDAVALAVQGRRPFARSQPITCLAQLYDDYLQAVVRADSPIRAPADMAAAVVSVGPPASGTELVALRLLDLLRVRPRRVERLGVSDAAEALRTGAIECFFFSGGLPTPAIAELGAAVPIRLLPLGDQAPELVRRYGHVYVRRTVPAQVYGLAAKVVTLGAPNLLVARDSMSADVAYLLTRLLFESRTTLEQAHPEARHLHERTAVYSGPVPLHPGAVRYYREAKFGISTGLGLTFS
ncbi:C4-dicarboxylate ABC transporter substrate-binding protein [Sphaerisporangium siamense]|uniref:TRAP transporter TAXI family solute receptor n=1 Tax=Sphaerisporangium siamense TaxID=795645 RepID=A0A7W7G8G1_9ACTN|nr:TAXI family TRAP transporter solute-binding subunit [Sphaerisporangium siamense]MBB4699489.1 TRAP transporter TAXI family solute receptor [Sphaerisporangium siamense]GII86902.1 C4-dicarboxylate ABC transporter substrate-binding protein [Sphaerisporangium siamense]